MPAMLAAVQAGATKLVHTPHGNWMTDADVLAVKQAGIPVLTCVGFGVPVFGVFNDDNVPRFRDGKPWPAGILDGKGRGREAGEKAVNARTSWDAESPTALAQTRIISRRRGSPMSCELST